MDKNGEPHGGKWSYDDQNRQPVSQIKKVKTITYKKNNDECVIEAIKYTNKHFPNNYGYLDDNTYFIYPIDTKSAIKWLDEFLQNKVKNFGTYQDVVLK